MTHLIPNEPSWREVPPEEDFTAEAHAPRVIIAYQDLNMGLRAMNVFTSISRDATSIEPAELSLWRFDLLQYPKWQARAAAHAKHADVLIVAMRRDHALPAYVHSWIKHWSWCRNPPQGALAVVFETAAARCDTEQYSNAVHLQEMAAAVGLDFICGVPMTGQEGLKTEWQSSSPET